MTCVHLQIDNEDAGNVILQVMEMEKCVLFQRNTKAIRVASTDVQGFVNGSDSRNQAHSL